MQVDLKEGNPKIRLNGFFAPHELKWVRQKYFIGTLEAIKGCAFRHLKKIQDLAPLFDKLNIHMLMTPTEPLVSTNSERAAWKLEIQNFVRSKEILC